jgi:tetratricopeptide (TPR) repeat protein
MRLFEEAGRGNSRAAANLHDDWATIWMNSGNPRRALEEIDLGWKILRDLAPAALETDKRLSRRARILAQLGDYDAALAEYRKAGELAGPRGNVGNLAAIRIGEAEVRTQMGALGLAGADLDAAGSALRHARLPASSLISVRYQFTRGEWLAARGERRAARDQFTEVLALYEAQQCCLATRSQTLSARALVTLPDDLAAAEADAASARELAPPVESAAFSRFTGKAYYASGLVFEKQRRWREARDAFATAAVQFAGAAGDAHPETLRSRDAILRMEKRVSTQSYN